MSKHVSLLAKPSRETDLELWVGSEAIHTNLKLPQVQSNLEADKGPGLELPNNLIQDPNHDLQIIVCSLSNVADVFEFSIGGL